MSKTIGTPYAAVWSQFDLGTLSDVFQLVPGVMPM